MTDIVDDPDPVMLLGAIVAVSPIDGVRMRLMVPLNPFSPFIVIVELPVPPARIVVIEGLAAIEKSTTWTMTVVVCVRVPLELLTVTV